VAGRSFCPRPRVILLVAGVLQGQGGGGHEMMV